MEFTSIVHSPTLLKGAISNAFDYSSSKALVTKKGKEVRGMAGKKVAELNDAIKDSSQLCQVLMSSLDIYPEALVCEYWGSDNTDPMVSKMKVFSWRQIDEAGRDISGEEQNKEMEMPDDTSGDTEEQKKMRLFNQNVRTITDSLQDIKYLTTIINNLSDSQEIDLTVSQLQALGF